MEMDAPTISNDGRPDCWSDDDLNSDIMDGRLSAIMPRKLFRDDAAVKSGLLQVFVRMKPVPEATDTCMVLDDRQMLKATWRNTEALYKFSKVFQANADQQAVYDGTTASLVHDFLYFRQPSTVVMAYGVTSAGKTFTMQGTPESPGLVPLALGNIFQTLTSVNRKDDRISLSVCEIYNESIHDLLAPPHQRAKPTALRLKEDKCGNITVVGAAQVPVQSSKEALELLKRAAKARQSAGTAVNEHSSRSHAVITIKLQSSLQESCQGCDATGKESNLHFVDLAGCERVKRTGNSGARLRESVAINSSLMTLARCLEVLRYNQQHPADQKVIPYRESKVTHLFKGVLHGNGRFVMVVNVSPASEAFNETKRVLQYAALASKVNMTSEIEHDIAGEAWPTTHILPRESAGQPASAADTAGAAAVSAALAAAHTRIEELLDDKADLEYEIDVVERKVELLREELIKSEIEKEQLEADIRAEVQEEMQQLIQQATAREKDRAAQAEKEALTCRQKADELEGLHLQQQEQLQNRAAEQKQLKELQRTAEHAKRTMLPLSQHHLLLKQETDAAAEAATQQDAQHNAQVAQLEQQHKQQLSQVQKQLSQVQKQLSAARAEADVLREQHASAVATARQQSATAEAFSRQQLADLQQLVVGAVQLLQQVVGQQQQGAAEVQELAAAAQQVHASLQLQQAHHEQQVLGWQQLQQDRAFPVAEATAGASDATEACVISDAVAEAQQQQLEAAIGIGLQKAQPAAEQEAFAVRCSEDDQQKQQPMRHRSRRVTMANHAEPPALNGASDRDKMSQLVAVQGRRSRRCTVAGRLAPLQAHEPIVRIATAGSPAAAAAVVGCCEGRRRTIAPGAAASQPGEPIAAPGRQPSNRRHSTNPGDAVLPVAVADACMSGHQHGAAAGQGTAALMKPLDLQRNAEVGQIDELQQHVAAPAADVGGRVKRSSRRQTLDPASTGGAASARIDAAGTEAALQPSATARADVGIGASLYSQSLIPIPEEEEEQEDPVIEACVAAGTPAVAATGQEGANGTPQTCRVALAEKQYQEKTAAAAAGPGLSRKRHRTAGGMPDACHQPQATAAEAAATSSPEQQEFMQQPAGGVQRHDRRKRRKTGAVMEPEAQKVERHEPDMQAVEDNHSNCHQQRQVDSTKRELKAADPDFAAGIKQLPVLGAGSVHSNSKSGGASAASKARKGSRAVASSFGRSKKIRAIPELRSSDDNQQQQQSGNKQGQQQQHVSVMPEQHVVVAATHLQAREQPVAAPGKRKKNTKHIASRACAADAAATVAGVGSQDRTVTWQSAELVLRDVTRQQVGQAMGRRATYAATGKASVEAVAGQQKQCMQKELLHIAGGITPVAYRTRHRGPK